MNKGVIVLISPAALIAFYARADHGNYHWIYSKVWFNTPSDHWSETCGPSSAPRRLIPVSIMLRNLNIITVPLLLLNTLFALFNLLVFVMLNKYIPEQGYIPQLELLFP
jgi:uncharacterized membrane protein YbaN (DUF454 family)